MAVLPLGSSTQRDSQKALIVAIPAAIDKTAFCDNLQGGEYGGMNVVNLNSAAFSSDGKNLEFLADYLSKIRAHADEPCIIIIDAQDDVCEGLVNSGLVFDLVCHKPRGCRMVLPSRSSLASVMEELLLAHRWESCG